MARPPYSWNVFLNVPFDRQYQRLLDALVFVVYDCGFVPRCALEEDNSGNVRFERIQALIGDCRYAIHDISRTQLDRTNRLPRFNMPLELGVFIGARRFGMKKHRDKNCLILDIERYRYQKFISDIAGHDIKEHGNDAATLIRRVRDWLNTAAGGQPMPGGGTVANRYLRFRKDLPKLCEEVPIGDDELTFVDYCHFVEAWLKANAVVPA